MASILFIVSEYIIVVPFIVSLTSKRGSLMVNWVRNVKATLSDGWSRCRFAQETAYLLAFSIVQFSVTDDPISLICSGEIAVMAGV